jgi:hypothetical protein
VSKDQQTWRPEFKADAGTPPPPVPAVKKAITPVGPKAPAVKGPPKYVDLYTWSYMYDTVEMYAERRMPEGAGRGQGVE